MNPNSKNNNFYGKLHNPELLYRMRCSLFSTVKQNTNIKKEKHENSASPQGDKVQEKFDTCHRCPL